MEDGPTKRSEIHGTAETQNMGLPTKGGDGGTEDAHLTHGGEVVPKVARVSWGTTMTTVC